MAVTYENKQIFQHFRHTEQFKIYKIISSEVADTNSGGAQMRKRWLRS